MRHRKAGKQLSRNSSHRRALLRNMTTSLLKYEQIETTDAKAKTIRPIAEKMITLAKRGDLHARRQALSFLQDKSVAHKLFDVIKDRYIDRQGGYVRIVKKGIRKGDGAPVSILQLLPKDEAKKAPKKRAAKSKDSTDTKPGESLKVDTGNAPVIGGGGDQVAVAEASTPKDLSDGGAIETDEKNHDDSFTEAERGEQKQP